MSITVDEGVQERKCAVIFPFYCEFGGRSQAVELIKKSGKQLGVMRPDSKNIVHITKPKGWAGVDRREKVCFNVAHPQTCEDWR